MPPVPERLIPFNGIPMSRVPPFLATYADCVDGIVCVPEPHDFSGTRWQLWRGGKVVGQVDIPWDDQPYGSGPERAPMRQVLGL